MVYDNPISDKIYVLLTPLLGTVLADATLRVQCKKVGASVDTLSASHLSTFAKNLEIGLIIFIGSEKAKTISRNIENLVS